MMLCLIQCGQTTWGAQGRMHGSTDLPLSDEGRASLNANLHLLEGCKASTVHHPADEAAAQSAHLCAQRIKARTREVAALADPSLGLLEGMTLEQFAERFPSRQKQWEDDLACFAAPEGESMHAAAARVFTALAQILKRARSEEVAVVLHNHALGMVRCWLDNRPLAELRGCLQNAAMIERRELPADAIVSLKSRAESVLAAT